VVREKGEFRFKKPKEEKRGGPKCSLTERRGGAVDDVLLYKAFPGGKYDYIVCSGKQKGGLLGDNCIGGAMGKPGKKNKSHWKESPKSFPGRVENQLHSGRRREGKAKEERNGQNEGGVEGKRNVYPKPKIIMEERK